MSPAMQFNRFSASLIIREFEVNDQRVTWPSPEFIRQFNQNIEADERSREEWVRMCNKMRVTQEEIEATLPAPPLSERGFGT